MNASFDFYKNRSFAFRNSDTDRNADFKTLSVNLKEPIFLRQQRVTIFTTCKHCIVILWNLSLKNLAPHY